MWHRLWSSSCRPSAREQDVVAEPPKIVVVALAAGMIVGALIAPAPVRDVPVPTFASAPAGDAVAFSD